MLPRDLLRAWPFPSYFLSSPGQSHTWPLPTWSAGGKTTLSTADLRRLLRRRHVGKAIPGLCPLGRPVKRQRFPRPMRFASCDARWMTGRPSRPGLLGARAAASQKAPGGNPGTPGINTTPPSMLKRPRDRFGTPGSRPAISGRSLGSRRRTCRCTSRRRPAPSCRPSGPRPPSRV